MNAKQISTLLRNGIIRDATDAEIKALRQYITVQCKGNIDHLDYAEFTPWIRRNAVRILVLHRPAPGQQIDIEEAIDAGMKPSAFAKVVQRGGTLELDELKGEVHMRTDAREDATIIAALKHWGNGSGCRISQAEMDIATACGLHSPLGFKEIDELINRLQGR